MTQRTCNIIKACKKPQKYKTDNEVEAVKRYMSIECDCPIEHYTDGVIENIMLEAMYDYIDTCDCPSFFLREMNTLYNADKLDVATKIAITFKLVQVKADKGEEWINGFYEELWNNQTDEIFIETDGKYLNVVIDTSSTAEDLTWGDNYVILDKGRFGAKNLYTYPDDNIDKPELCRRVICVNGKRA